MASIHCLLILCVCACVVVWRCVHVLVKICWRTKCRLYKWKPLEWRLWVITGRQCTWRWKIYHNKQTQVRRSDYVGLSVRSAISALTLDTNATGSYLANTMEDKKSLTQRQQKKCTKYERVRVCSTSNVGVEIYPVNKTKAWCANKTYSKRYY